MLIGVEAREGFTNCNESQIKCAARIIMHEERIKLVDNGNKHGVYPSFDALETWEHVVLCDKMKDKRHAQVKKIEKSFNDVAKKLKESKYEKTKLMK